MVLYQFLVLTNAPRLYKVLILKGKLDKGFLCIKGIVSWKQTTPITLCHITHEKC